MSKLVWNTKNEIKPSSLESLSLELLQKRGLSKKEAKDFISPNYDRGLGDPFLITGMDIAVDRIMSALSEGEQVAIYGDYDIDGLSASALLYDALSQMGLKPRLYIPDRF